MSGAARSLIIVRHAKAAHPPGMADRDRPLTARGEAEARLAGELLTEALSATPTVLVSPAMRTRQTWELLSGASADMVPATYDHRIYSAGWTELLRVLREVPAAARQVILVGHNPGCAELVAELTDEPPASFPTAGVARIAVAQPWSDLSSGHLIGFTVPRVQPD